MTKNAIALELMVIIQSDGSHSYPSLIPFKLKKKIKCVRLEEILTYVMTVNWMISDL